MTADSIAVVSCNCCGVAPAVALGAFRGVSRLFLDYGHDDGDHQTDHGDDDMDHQPHDHDLGLSNDLATLVGRRRALGLLAGAGAALVLAACGSSGSGVSAGASTTSAGASSAGTTGSSAAGTTGSSATATTATGPTATSAATAVAVIPEETAGPFPGDGSNGVNVLTESGIVRRDIRPSFGSSTTVATGVDATTRFQILDAAGAPLAGAAVYVWHCDQQGRYSMYSDGAQDENYLRGVQETGADGTAEFLTVWPACYDGRWPHMHFEVYPSLSEATAAGSKLATSQLALPEGACSAVYATDGYDASVSNLSRVSLSTDMVFSDGVTLETPTVTGSPTDGYTISAVVAVAA
jgi:protocatechuate 3,4-dioxygenase beta subunit